MVWTPLKRIKKSGAVCKIRFIADVFGECDVRLKLFSIIQMKNSFFKKKFHEFAISMNICDIKKGSGVLV